MTLFIFFTILIVLEWCIFVRAMAAGVIEENPKANKLGVIAVIAIFVTAVLMNVFA